VAKATSDCNLVANRYQIAAKLSFYLKAEIPTLNVRARPNQFDIWRWEERLTGKPVCWLTQARSFPGAEWVTPEGTKLRLVRDMELDELLALKASGRSLGAERRDRGPKRFSAKGAEKDAA
jgi:hypothetical protein